MKENAMETISADTIPAIIPQQDEDEMSKDFLPSCQDCRNFSVCKLNREFHNPRFGELHDSLSEAIEGDQLEMYLQFIYSVKEKRLTGAEALSRWNHPERGVLPPSSYIKGVETEEQEKMVIGLGVEFIQGFYYSRVYPLKEGLCYFHEHDRVDAF